MGEQYRSACQQDQSIAQEPSTAELPGWFEEYACAIHCGHRSAGGYVSIVGHARSLLVTVGVCWILLQLESPFMVFAFRGSMSILNIT